MKQPYCFEVNDGVLFAFAGLWDRWKDPSGQWIKSCSILTTTPNAVTSSVHDRMPVILDPDCYDLWLDPGMHDMKAVSDMLKPYDAQLMRSYPVSHRVNHVVNDDAECSTPINLSEMQAGLLRSKRPYPTCLRRFQNSATIRRPSRKGRRSTIRSWDGQRNGEEEDMYGYHPES